MHTHALRVDKTPYDAFLSHLVVLIAALPTKKRKEMAGYYDRMATFAGYQLLNGVFSADRYDPNDGEHKRPFLALLQDASDFVEWKVEKGTRPKWLHSISDAELDELLG